MTPEAAEHRVTRGHGLLEKFLASRRAHQANSLIPEKARSGRILDVGCGSYPTFLFNTRFAERYGVDRVTLTDVRDDRLTLVEHDIAGGSGLPFEDSFFEVVTMLAVFEHLETAALRRLLQEIRRVLRPGGFYVLTTPVRWTEGLLKLMSSVGLLSHEEVNEHKAQYSAPEVVTLLLDGGFERSNIRHGTFELGMNHWAVAQRNR